MSEDEHVPGADADGRARCRIIVSPAPFDPYSVERASPEQEKIYLASQWRMMCAALPPPPRRGGRLPCVLAVMYLAILLVIEFAGALQPASRNVELHLCAAAAGAHVP